MKKRILLPLLWLFSLPAAASEPLPSLFLEDLTWMEVKTALEQGYDRVLIPTGGTEQNGAHLTLGKHNCIIRYTSQQIAEELGNTLIAPIIAYVPEAPHMAYTGTISLSEETFYDLLRDTVESLKQHGFRKIYLLGDSYGNQPPQEELAEDLAEDYAEEGVVLASLHDYYAANGQVAWLQKEKGYSEAEVGGHAGIRDTSEMLAVCPEGVRTDKIRDNPPEGLEGANGKATAASAGIGQKLLELKIQAAVREIKKREKTSD